jgi:type IV secretion system protein VirB5
VKTESLTPEQVLLTDEIANEKYVGLYAERKLSRLVIAAGSVLLLSSFGVIVSLAHRPIQNRYIRIDEMGKATAIQYSDLAYSPREGEIRSYLTDWANYRYTINRETISKKYPMNYYFLSTQLANQYMGADNAAHLDRTERR